jgi:hypothetical protein
VYSIVRVACSSKRGSPVAAIAMALAMISAPLGECSAQGLFDFLFGSPRRPDPPPAPPPAPEVRAPLATSPGFSGGGRSQPYCVRLCDGRYFPVQHGSATPERLCQMLCPASQTRIFWGSDIEHAVARDGGRYSGLANAYLFRKREVANCTCNGRDSFGLAPIDVASDPTLRRGDLVVPADPNAPPVAATDNRNAPARGAPASAR